MGAQLTKNEVTSKEYLKNLVNMTNKSEEKIIEWYELFEKAAEAKDFKAKLQHSFDNDDNYPQLTRGQFVRFYSQLRDIDEKRMKDLAIEIFRIFDQDSNRRIDFQEFVAGYVITSGENIRNKLDYLFRLYDLDASSKIDKNELEAVLKKMVIFLNCDDGKDSLKLLVKTIMINLDRNKDGKIDKYEFIDGLLKDPTFHFYLSPFENK